MQLEKCFLIFFCLLTQRNSQEDRPFASRAIDHWFNRSRYKQMNLPVEIKSMSSIELEVVSTVDEEPARISLTEVTKIETVLSE